MLSGNSERETMYITNEMDYTLRILRILYKKGLTTALIISEEEHIPKAFVYKILNKLDKKNLIESKRGRNGGYILPEKTLHMKLGEIFNSIDKEQLIAPCIDKDYDCINNKDDRCNIHRELKRIQLVIDIELNRKTIEEILLGK